MDIEQIAALYGIEDEDNPNFLSAMAMQSGSAEDMIEP
jgi:hypothetical protein